MICISIFHFDLDHIYSNLLLVLHWFIVWFSSITLHQLREASNIIKTFPELSYLCHILPDYHLCWFLQRLSTSKSFKHYQNFSRVTTFVPHSAGLSSVLIFAMLMLQSVIFSQMKCYLISTWFIMSWDTRCLHIWIAL